MKDSSLIKQAQACIEAVKNKSLTLKERIKISIDLAALMLKEAFHIQTPEEKKRQTQMAAMMADPMGKVFTTAITDQCFRSHRNSRIANQLNYMIHKYGMPKYLSLDKRIAMKVFELTGQVFASIAVPLTIKMLRKETSHVILPGEPEELKKHMEQRRQEGVRVNLNRLGEAILGEQEAAHRLQIYLEDLAKPEVEYISVKISTIYSQINLLAWNQTVEALSERLRQLYRMAMNHYYVRPDGTRVPKFVNLDMEEYRDLHLTIEVFRKVLDETEFRGYSAGIVLQSYLPDSFAIQKELTEWAMKRVKNGGAPIKIRIVKGANLAMEQVEAAIRLWPQAPYTTKKEVDANYKSMVMYACQKEHAQAAHVGIASHNLFDIAYALLLRAENGVEKEVSFEMLEGMADHIRRVVQQLAGDILLYCPAAKKEEFQNAVAYLVRRLDENTAPENFLRQAFNLSPETPQWDHQAELFADACLSAQFVTHEPRRQQNRQREETYLNENGFCNESDTDWSLPNNREWAHRLLSEWKDKTLDPVPLVIGGQKIYPQPGQEGIGEDPSICGRELYRYSLATSAQIDQALNIAQSTQKKWSETPFMERADLLKKIAQQLRSNRKDLIGSMVADTAKTVIEADIEVSEAIDFAEYYSANLKEWYSLEDIQWHAKGTVLVASPWNFPCSIPAGGILAALATGNCVIFKPATESILVGWFLVQLFWKAGVSPDVLQFIVCEDDPIGSQLIKDPRISAVVLTGATSTAKLFMRLRPSLDLIAETGGKNTMVITALADRDLAIKDLVQSAFGHAGQKCSACSLAILEAEVYDDPHFRQQLKDAAASLTVGSAWDLKTRVNPLIRDPNPTLMKGLTQLEKGEEWLLEPKQHPEQSNLWSPGIKLGVKPSSFTFQNELFGPVLGLVRAKHFEHALNLMNRTPYGLTAGIHSLDEREQLEWERSIEAGNCYINRTITGAVVQRQPFGGCKDSSFGRGAKAGGPNYLTQLMRAEQAHLPKEWEKGTDLLDVFTQILKRESFLDNRHELWDASLGSYNFYWQHYFLHKHDPSQVLGQDNVQSYVPHHSMVLRVQSKDLGFDVMRVIAATMICRLPLEISFEEDSLKRVLSIIPLIDRIAFLKETENEFIKRVRAGKIHRIRLISQASPKLQEALAEAACHLNIDPVLANGRLELLHYLREVSVSCDYHRYGNLGEREYEQRESACSKSKTHQSLFGTCCCYE